MAQSVLDGSFDEAEYDSLVEEHRIAVSLCLAQGWLDEMAYLAQTPAMGETTLTHRVFAFLAWAPLDHATLAVRNVGRDRDGGGHDFMGVVVRLKLTRVPAFMEVFVKIRARWKTAGFDWSRRAREEAALRATPAIPC